MPFQALPNLPLAMGRFAALVGTVLLFLVGMTSSAGGTIAPASSSICTVPIRESRVGGERLAARVPPGLRRVSIEGQVRVVCAGPAVGCSSRRETLENAEECRYDGREIVGHVRLSRGVSHTTFAAVAGGNTTSEISLIRRIPVTLSYDALALLRVWRTSVATKPGASLVDDVAAACKTHSFRRDTEVLMADGSRKAISEVEVGDRVLATDPVTGESAVRTVTVLHRHTDTDLAEVTVVDADGDVSVLHTTQHHPFWNLTDQAWEDAGQLGRGDRLRSNAGQLVTVVSVRSFTGVQWMYDLTVDDLHTYYVAAGDEPVLVHNCGKWLSPKDFADDLARDVRNSYRGGATETGQHAAGLRAAVRDLRGRIRNDGYLPEVNAQLKKIADAWEARANGINHPGGQR